MSTEQALVEELARVTQERDQARELLKKFMHGADQRFLNEQIMYLQQALALEVADGKKARYEAAALRRELTLWRRLNELRKATVKDSLTVGATAEESSVDHIGERTEMVKEVQA